MRWGEKEGGLGRFIIHGRGSYGNGDGFELRGGSEAREVWE